MNLHERARELLEVEGFTALRAFRRLKSEYPSCELYELWIAVGGGPKGISPSWAERSAPKSASIRNDPRAGSVQKLYEALLSDGRTISYKSESLTKAKQYAIALALLSHQSVLSVRSKEKK